MRLLIVHGTMLLPHMSTLVAANAKKKKIFNCYLNFVDENVSVTGERSV